MLYKCTLVSTRATLIARIASSLAFLSGEWFCVCDAVFFGVQRPAANVGTTLACSLLYSFLIPLRVVKQTKNNPPASNTDAQPARTQERWDETTTEMMLRRISSDQSSRRKAKAAQRAEAPKVRSCCRHAALLPGRSSQSTRYSPPQFHSQSNFIYKRIRKSWRTIALPNVDSPATQNLNSFFCLFAAFIFRTEPIWSSL